MRSRGFTLIEALIGLVILSVGLLGAAAMLLGSLGSHTDALRRAAALALVRDVADRIRMNGTARSAYQSGGAAPAATDCATAPCEPAALAAADRAFFERSARDRFPVGTLADIRVEPAIGPAAPDRYVISLRFPRRDDPQRSRPDAADGVALTVLVHAPVAGA